MASNHLKIKVGVDNSSIQSSAKAIKSAFLGLGSTLATAFSVNSFINFAKESVSLASDVQEVQNVVDTAFGSMKSKMEEFADTAIDTYGISKLTAKQTGSKYMSMAVSLGLTQEAASDMALSLTGLSADMASFYNIEQSVADTALQSVFTGETETLKKYGIVMTQTNLQEFARQKGISKSISAMTRQEQTMLRYQYVLQQTQLVQGDFERTQDSWANKTKTMAERWNEVKIAFGETFKTLAEVALPVVEALQTALSGVAAVLHQSMVNLGLITESEETSTSSVADNIATATDNQNDLTEATEETAKAADNSVAGFDEVNQLSQETAETASDSGTDTTSALESLTGGTSASTTTSGNQDVQKGVSTTFGLIMEIIGGALIVIGVILLCLCPAQIGLGIALIVAGAGLFVSGLIATKDFDKKKVESVILSIVEIVSLALVVIGVIMLCVGGPSVMGLAIAFIVAGAALFVTSAILGNEGVSEKVKTIISVVMAIVATAAIVIGIILLFNPATVAMGITLICAGAVGLVTVITANKDAIVNWIKEIWQKVKDFWNAHIAKVFTKAFWSKIFDVIGDALKAALNWIIGLLNGAIDKANTLLTPVRAIVYGVAKAFGKSIKFSDVKIPHIPKLAQGAVLPANKPFLAQLGDQKNGRNLEAPESLLREIYSEQNAPLVSLLQELIEVEKTNRTIVADGKEIARTVNNANKKMGTNITSGAFAYVR